MKTTADRDMLSSLHRASRLRLVAPSYEPQATGSVKFDDDCDVIFMFKM